MSFRNVADVAVAAAAIDDIEHGHGYYHDGSRGYYRSRHGLEEGFMMYKTFQAIFAIVILLIFFAIFYYATTHATAPAAVAGLS